MNELPSNCCHFFTQNWLRIAGQDLVYNPRFCPACGLPLKDKKKKVDKTEKG